MKQIQIKLLVEGEFTEVQKKAISALGPYLSDQIEHALEENDIDWEDLTFDLNVI